MNNIIPYFLYTEMALDQNLFTLNIVPQDENTSLLFDPMGVVYYRKERIAGPIYTTHVIGATTIFPTNVFVTDWCIADPISESTLATVTAPSTTSKHKTIELHNPSVPIQLTFVGTLYVKSSWCASWNSYHNITGHFDGHSSGKSELSLIWGYISYSAVW